MKLESLEELHIFTQIVESGSMTAAARILGLPPNTVSRRLAALEERLGTKLLYRTTRNLSLSETGRTLFERAHRILEEAHAAELALQSDTEGLQGTVKISVPSILTSELLKSCASLLSGNPNLDLQISVNDRLVNPVSEGLDVVIMGGMLADTSLIARKITTIRPFLAASAQYLATHGEPQHPNELRQHAHIAFMTGATQPSWTFTDPEGQQHVIPIEARIKANDGRTLQDALVAGLGIGMTSARGIHQQPTLQRILPEYTLRTIPIYAIYPVSGKRSAKLQAVLNTLEKALLESMKG